MTKRLMNKPAFFSRLSTAYFVIGVILIICAFFVLLISLQPSIWYSINKNASAQEADSITTVATESDAPEDQTPEPPEEDPLPPLDPNLPQENMLLIPTIEVNSKIIQDQNAKSGLDQGIWIVPDFGTPDNNELPIIIAAHRFGYVTWTPEFRTSSSFYNLPKTRVGDTAKIIWGQREYEFEVYKVEEGSQITDYNADLILYTCKLFNSPVRIFRYLERTN